MSTATAPETPRRLPDLSAISTNDIEGPPLPMGRRIDLPDRGITFVREVEGPPGAPTLLLLHGWFASAGLNWFTAFEPLSEHFNIVAPDLRGHGRGIRSRRRFRLADCADDLDALLEILEIDQAIAVGYSMGGPVSQLLWKRHPRRVAGLVLCATSDGFVPVMRERFIFTTFMASLAGTTRVGQVMSRMPTRWVRKISPAWARRQSRAPSRPGNMQRWAGQEMRRHDARHLMEAGVAIGNYNAKRWTGDIDVPTAVVLTELDRAIEPDRQRAMADRIPGATVHPVMDGHIACANEEWIPGLLAACQAVAERL